MRKKIVMLLFNNFSNDARVLKEGKSLAEIGYDVELICVQENKKALLPSKEAVVPYFHVTRVGGEKKQRVTLLALCLLVISIAILVGNLLGIILSIMMFFILQIPKIQCTVLIGITIMTMAVVARSRKANYFQAHDLNTLPQAHFAAKSRLQKKQLIYDSHEVQTSREGYNGWLHKKVEQFYIQKIDFMIVENDTRAAFNEQLYGFLPGVIHNYPEYEEEITNNKFIHELLELPPNEKILLYQGVINPGRGLEKLVEAAPLFKEGTLVFIGDGRQKAALQKRVIELKLTSRVKFISKVPLHELKNYTQQAFLGFQVLNNTCFNHYSASSNKLFEYIAAEIPVVACEFPEIKKVVDGDKVGICIDSHSPKAIAAGVNYMIQDLARYQNFKDNTKKIKKKYIWDREKVQLEFYYKHLDLKEQK
ncbi:glycosyltransferase family 4 protein [Listeria grandensis]|uniref:glycosyltransferase n=1 Tax=Listeria grandensis TaxID=1494963 RepID=UPI00162AD49A|nr:glycosyltransferase [Listeria grandensis]MBC1474003.1 glycosyltransferase family 4 protein [Listeria grandensis]